MKLNSRIERGSTKEFLAKSLSISRVPRLRSSSSCVLNHTYCIEYCCLRRGLVTGDFPIRRRPSFFSFLFFLHHLPSAPHHSSLFYGLAGNQLGLSHSLSLSPPVLLFWITTYVLLLLLLLLYPQLVELVWLLLRLLPRVRDKVKEAKGNEKGTTFYTDTLHTIPPTVTNRVWSDQQLLSASLMRICNRRERKREKKMVAGLEVFLSVLALLILWF